MIYKGFLVLFHHTLNDYRGGPLSDNSRFLRIRDIRNACRVDEEKLEGGRGSEAV